jgi:hypothetical protein
VILGAVIGAAVTGFFYWAVGTYHLRKSFEHSEHARRQAVLRTEIRVLQRVEQQIRENTDLLINLDYPVSVGFKAVGLLAAIDAGGQNKPMYEALMAIGDSVYVVIGEDIPDRKFGVNAWRFFGYPQEINVKLSKELDDLYILLDASNTEAKNFRELVVGQSISGYSMRSVQRSVGEYNRLVGKLMDEKMFTRLGDSVREEKKRLTTELESF